LKPNETEKFAIDAMLGNIAKKLRILGFDSYYSSHVNDDDLLQIALHEKRVLITRDVHLFQRALKNDVKAILLNDESEKEQLYQIKNKLNLKKFEMITNGIRCSICNDKLISINKEDIRSSDHILDGVLENYDTFWKCLICNKIYWRGTHINNLQRFIDGINKMDEVNNYITDKDGEILVKTARSIVKDYLQHKDNKDLIKELKTKFDFNSGVFVTLNDPNGLRGCIGFPLPDKKLYDALSEAAISAATRDPRFSSITIEELDNIVFEVTVLTTPQKIIVSNPDEYISKIKIGRDGLIVKHMYDSGLLLPQVPVEYGWSEQEFLEHTCEKAGISRDSWRRKETEISKFEGIIFQETEPKGEVKRKAIDA
jgi:uncharacterized protein (TIGR00296 family)